MVAVNKSTSEELSETCSIGHELDAPRKGKLREETVHTEVGVELATSLSTSRMKRRYQQQQLLVLRSRVKESSS